MKKVPLFVFFSLAITGLGFAQTTAATDPVGFVSISVPAASDYSLGFPLHRPSEFQGVIQSISGNTITVAGTPGWSTSQFVYAQGTQAKTYYVQIDSGTKEGQYAKITANDATSITLTLNSGDDLSNILTNAANGTGDMISIIPYWTPSTLFSGMTPGTQLLLFPSGTAGINLAASFAYVFSGSSWFQGATNVDDAVLDLGLGLVLRNNSASVASVAVTGAVPMTANRYLFRTLAANTKQDNRFFFNSPVPEIIGNTGLGITPGDQLLVFDNTATGKNKAPVFSIVWSGSAWFQGATDVTATFALQPGTSYILRKNSTASPQTFVSSGLPSYLAP